MSPLKSRLFEPCYIWKCHQETKESGPKSEQKFGVLTRMLGLKTQEKYKSAEELNDRNNKSIMNNKQKAGSVLRISNSRDDKFIFNWRSGSEKIKNMEVSEKELLEMWFETLKKCNYQCGEFFLDLKKSNSLPATELYSKKISVGKLYLRMESIETLEFWLGVVSAEDLHELSIAPFGDQPNDIPSHIFEYPHFRNCRTLCLMDHCSFSSEQFLTICSSVPHFSFYSDTISENVARTAIEKQVTMTGDNFIVLEWFFSRKVDTHSVIQDVVRPRGDRRERFSHQKQCFEPVDIYSVSNENNKKLSVMIVEDSSSFSKPYSLVLFS